MSLQNRGRPAPGATSTGGSIRLLGWGDLLLVLTMIAVAALALYQGHAAHEDRAVTATQNLSLLLSRELAASFDKIDLGVLEVRDEVEREVATGRVDRGRINARIALHASRRPELDEMRVSDARGVILYGTRIVPGSAIDLSDRDFFQQLRDEPGAGLVVSKPVLGRISGKWTIVFARRINTADGRFAGIAYAVVFVDRLQKIFAELELGANGVASLRDLSLATVARYPNPAPGVSATGNGRHSDEWAQKLRENSDFGSYFAVGIDGRNRALSYRRVTGYPFYALVGLSPKDYLAPWYREVGKTLAFLLAAILALVLYRSVGRAWSRRDEDSTRLLSVSLDALGQSEGRFRQLTEAMPQIAFLRGADGATEYVSSRWRQTTGLPDKAALGMGWVDAVHPEDRDILWSKWRHSLATGDPVECAYRLTCADGTYRWHLSRALPVRDREGKITRWVGTSTDIDDAKRLEEKLRMDDRRKDEFLATLAHELRNPLAPIKNALHVMRLSKDRRVREESREMIERQLDHLVKLVNDLFDISRITQGRLGLHKERIDLREAIRDGIEASPLRFEKEGRRLSVVLPADPVPVDADGTRLAQVVSNLLSNAARYTPADGRIVLTLALADQRATISVRDTGAGIPADMREKIFDMFVQADRRLDKSHGGLGLGLAIVRQIVHMHGGEVIAKSDGPGKGAEFVVTLPIVQAAPRVDPLDAPAGADARPPTPACKVLVVDDNADSVTSLATLLEFMGHQTAVAYDGFAALEVAEKFRPDVVFLDLGMPKLDGYSTARKLRERHWGRETYLVALSGWGQDEDRRKSRDAGFDHHLVKPASHEEIEQCLARSVEKRYAASASNDAERVLTRQKTG